MNGQDGLDRRLEELGEAPPETDAGPAGLEAEARALERRITRRIRRVCLKTLLCVALCAALLFLCINPLMKLSALDPIRMEKDDMGFTRYLNAYYGTMQPYVRVSGVGIRDTGFGTYDASLYVAGADDLGIGTGGYTDVHLSVRQGRAAVTSDPSGTLTKRLGRFVADWGGDRDSILAELEKLPDSSFIRLSLSTKEALPLSRLRALPAEVVWAQVYHPDNLFQGGIDLSSAVLLGGDTDPREMDDAQLAQYYADNLELLLTQPELLKSLGIFSGNTVFYTLEEVEDALAFAREQQTLTSKNYCIAGDKAEVVALIKQVRPVRIQVDHIFLSPLSD